MRCTLGKKDLSYSKVEAVVTCKRDKVTALSCKENYRLRAGVGRRSRWEPQQGRDNTGACKYLPAQAVNSPDFMKGSQTS